MTKRKYQATAKGRENHRKAQERYRAGRRASAVTSKLSCGHLDGS